MKKIAALILLCIAVPCLWTQALRETSVSGLEISNANDTGLPLKKVVILTSGLAYYEHSGTINGSKSMVFPFRLDAINDALKSIVIIDPSSANPSVTYSSENTLIQTLRSLSVDLSDNPGMAQILQRLRGAEVEISAPGLYTGRIAGVEYRQTSSSYIAQAMDTLLLLNTAGGLRAFNLNDVNSIKFTDPVIEQDINRALDLIAASRNSFSRMLNVNLPGSGTRDVSVSYVIPAPVWKVTYRLDFGGTNPRSALFQGWAIVDNDSDIDWRNVELSLVSGRPISFIQNLYPPYYVSRPVLPLSIAGTAEAASYDRAYPMPAPSAMARAESSAMATMDMMLKEEAEYQSMNYAGRAYSDSSLLGGVMETASGSEAGGQFEFTIRTPVNLDRRMSAMLPLVDIQIEARKLLIYSGQGRHPRLGAELTNTSGIKLPAGPITVFDGGVYSGDALIEFWNEGEKKLISFGEDLSVTAVSGNTSAQQISSVAVSGGVMTITRNLIYSRTYTFVNSGSAEKQLLLEHAKTANTALVSEDYSGELERYGGLLDEYPVLREYLNQSLEQTETHYRFYITLPANGSTSFTVNEQRPVSERITLLSQRPETILSYSSNTEIPANVRQALAQAAELRIAADAANSAARDIEAQRERLIADQARIRANLQAAGSATVQGQEYLLRLTALDREIDSLGVSLNTALENARAAQRAYEDYLNRLSL